MDDLVERVARAILSGHNWASGDLAPSEFDEITPAWQDAYRSMARSAIDELGRAISEMALLRKK